MRTMLFLLFLTGLTAYSQDGGTEKTQSLEASRDLTREANKKLTDNDFVEAEADYRRAISKSSENIIAPYNLGTAYYGKKSYGEAFGRFKEAGELATVKAEKHKAFHNMGNVFMKRKEYEKAVEAYKEALRNDPEDEETRYNLALAKEMLKKKQDEQKKDDKDQKDQNQDQKNDKDKQEDDKQDQKQDQNKDKGDEGDQKKEENKEGEGDEKKEQKEQPQQGDQPGEKQQPRPNQLSPQQIRNLLEAMQNEEKKVQEKMDARKVKGAKVTNEKDW